MTTDTWASRDLPVLKAIAELLEQNGGIGDTRALDRATGLPRTEVVKAVRALSTQYIDAEIFSSGTVPMRFTIRGVTADGYREAGQWPTPELGADRLLAALEQMIQSEPDGSEKKSRLEKVRDGLFGASKDVAVALTTAVLTGGLGLGG